MKDAVHDPPPFEHVYRDFRAKVHSYLLGMTRSQDEAEDLAQETFLKIERALPKFRGESSLSTWVYRVATNTCLDHFKRRETRESATTLPMAESGLGGTESADRGSPSPEKTVVQSEMSACVQDYVLELPPTYRIVIVLHDMQGLSNPEIAEVLGVSTGTVKTRVHRARAMLKAALDAGCAFEHDERNVLVCEPVARDTEAGCEAGGTET